jgi:hypothetical protein
VFNRRLHACLPFKNLSLVGLTRQTRGLTCTLSQSVQIADKVALGGSWAVLRPLHSPDFPPAIKVTTSAPSLVNNHCCQICASPVILTQVTHILFPVSPEQSRSVRAGCHRHLTC